jgi:PPOX class probable F420-dependent enzyme
MKTIPESHMDLLQDEKKAFVYLATINSDGTPQVTPIWFNAQDGNILINSAKGRIKDRNMRAHKNVALCIADPTNPYRYIQIQGMIAEITELGADDHIDALSLKYTGKEKYPYRQPGEVRVKYKVQIVKVDAHG